jgi:hypothetical protein
MAFLTAMSPLIATLHEASATHAFCPEDGELVDVAVQPAHAANLTGDGPELVREQPLAPEPTGGDHNHCIFAVFFAHATASFSRPAAIVGTSTLAITAVLPEPPRLRSYALYLLAPKASPPA